MHVHLSSLPIVSDLLVSLEDYFDQRLLKYAKQKTLLCRYDLPSAHVTSKHLS